jgi:hypothetical protein
MGFVAIVTVAAGLITGLLPGLALLRRFDFSGAIGEGRQSGGIHRSRFVSSLVVTQTVVSCALLIGALLFVRSVTNVRRVPLGMDLQHAVVVSLDARVLRTSASRADALFAELSSAVARVPGVVSVATAEGIPFSQWYLSTRIGVPGRAPDSPEIQRGALSGRHSSYLDDRNTDCPGPRVRYRRSCLRRTDRDRERRHGKGAGRTSTPPASVRPRRFHAHRRILSACPAQHRSRPSASESTSPYAATSTFRSVRVGTPLVREHLSPGSTRPSRESAGSGAPYSGYRTMPLADVWPAVQAIGDSTLATRCDDVRGIRGARSHGRRAGAASVSPTASLNVPVDGHQDRVGARAHIAALLGSRGARLAGIGIVIAVPARWRSRRIPAAAALSGVRAIAGDVCDGSGDDGCRRHPRAWCPPRVRNRPMSIIRSEGHRAIVIRTR